MTFKPGFRGAGGSKKFGNKRCIVTPQLGIFTADDMARAKIERTKSDLSFASTREAKRYVYLKQLEMAGEIRNLRLQVPFPLMTTTPEGLQAVVTRYMADFVYERMLGPGVPQWREIVEDSKGFKDQKYELKCKWLKLQYGIVIQEV